MTASTFEKSFLAIIEATFEEYFELSTSYTLTLTGNPNTFAESIAIKAPA